MLTTLLLICASFYFGGIVCCIGLMLGDMTDNEAVKFMQPMDYVYVLLTCLLWPAFIVQQITTKGE